jgi:hypothetical protein
LVYLHSGQTFRAISRFCNEGRAAEPAEPSARAGLLSVHCNAKLLNFFATPICAAGTKTAYLTFTLAMLSDMVGMGNMLRSEQADMYRLQAAQCVRLAQKSEDREVKIGLLTMARAWLSLADQHDKNSQNLTLVYETPEPRQQVAQQQQPQPKNA